MFKYLSDILSKFTPQQRLLALGLLLFTSVLLGLGNSIINSVSESDSVLQAKVKRLEVSQQILLNENDSLSSMISQNQIQCVRDIRDVRNQILEDLGFLEREMVNTKRKVSYKVEAPQTRYIDSSSGDTIMVSMMEAPSRVEVVDNSEEMIQAIRKLKEKIKNDNQ